MKKLELGDQYNELVGQLQVDLRKVAADFRAMAAASTDDGWKLFLLGKAIEIQDFSGDIGETR